MDLLFLLAKGGDILPQNDKTKEAFEKIEQGVKEVYQSDNFRQYLSMLTKFHDYSLNNTILILMQNSEAEKYGGCGQVNAKAIKSKAEPFHKLDNSIKLTVASFAGIVLKTKLKKPTVKKRTKTDGEVKKKTSVKKTTSTKKTIKTKKEA